MHGLEAKGNPWQKEDKFYPAEELLSKDFPHEISQEIWHQ